MGYKGFTRIIRVQLLALHRTPQQSHPVPQSIVQTFLAALHKSLCFLYSLHAFVSLFMIPDHFEMEVSGAFFSAFVSTSCSLEQPSSFMPLLPFFSISAVRSVGFFSPNFNVTPLTLQQSLHMAESSWTISYTPQMKGESLALG